MPEPRPADCRLGDEALARGAWGDARAAFERALAARESPEALEGLGLAGWWLDLADVVFDSRERAYRLYGDRGDRTAAARAAVWLAWDAWGPSAASTPSPAAGSSGPARCSRAPATSPSSRGSSSAKARSRCWTMAIRIERTGMPRKGSASGARRAHSIWKCSDVRCRGSRSSRRAPLPRGCARSTKSTQRSSPAN